MADQAAGAGSNPAKKFRLSGRRLFLTYSQVPEAWTKEELLTFLESALEPYTIGKYSVGREKHADGGFHFHVYLEMDRKMNIRDCRKFDREGFHPNIKPGAPRVHIGYSQKDGDFIANVSPENSYIGMAKRGELAEAEKAFAEAHPMQYVLHLHQVRTSLASLGTPPSRFRPRFGPHCRTLTTASTSWEKTTKTLVLLGPSGVGKTTWALAQGQAPLLVSHPDGLKKMTKETDLLVFDDMTFSHWPRTSVIHLTDLEQDRQINVKHGIVTIPAGLPRIITSNVGIPELFPADESGAIARRITVVDMNPVPMYDIFR